MNSYLLVFAVLLITTGRLGDLYGRKRLFVIGDCASSPWLHWPAASRPVSVGSSASGLCRGWAAP